MATVYTYYHRVLTDQSLENLGNRIVAYLDQFNTSKDHENIIAYIEKINGHYVCLLVTKVSTKIK